MARGATGRVVCRRRQLAEVDAGLRRVDGSRECQRHRDRLHPQRTQAGGPRWDVRVTDNTKGNALCTLQENLASSGTDASTRNLNAASG